MNDITVRTVVGEATERGQAIALIVSTCDGLVISREVQKITGLQPGTPPWQIVTSGGWE